MNYQSFSDAYASVYEAKYHISQANDEIEKLGKEGGNEKRIAAWKRLKSHEGSIPETKAEMKLQQKADRALKAIQGPKDKSVKFDKKGRGNGDGMAPAVSQQSRILRNKYGSADAGAKDPKINRKVDRIYNKMLSKDKVPQIQEKTMDYRSFSDAYDSIYESTKTPTQKKKRVSAEIATLAREVRNKTAGLSSHLVGKKDEDLENKVEILYRRMLQKSKKNEDYFADFYNELIMEKT